MTAVPVVNRPDAPDWEVAKLLADAAVHRVIVVGAGGRPVGVV